MNKNLYALVATLALAAGSATAAESSSSGSFRVLKPEETRSIAELLGSEVPKVGGIIRVGPSSFAPGAGRITFSEFPLNTPNPTYPPASYGGGAADPTVTFRGFFAGQALGAAGTCPPGAALTGCVVGTPSNPLTLSPTSPDTRIVNDGANPTSPVLSGTPTFNGPIAILFDRDLAAVGLDGGFFDSVGGTAITAFRRDGTVIGSVTNTANGIEFLGLATADGSETIAGFLFSLVGAEAAGFAIDNVRFARAGQVIPPGGQSVPVPATTPWGLLALVLALLVAGAAFVRLR